MRNHIFLLLGVGIFSLPNIVLANEHFTLEEPTKVMIPFEDLDADGSGTIEMAEAKALFEDLYEDMLKNGSFGPKPISFGAPEKKPSSDDVKINFTKEQFVEENIAQAFSMDADNDGVLSESEYQLRKNYKYSKEECQKIIDDNKTDSVSFANMVKSMQDGSSAKTSYCSEKYGL